MRSHNEDSRHVIPITDIQAVQSHTRTDPVGRETNRKLCLRNSALLAVCRTAL
jgi:hypothetical protein